MVMYSCISGPLIQQFASNDSAILTRAVIATPYVMYCDIISGHVIA